MSICELKLKPTWLMEQDVDSKHSGKSICECQKTRLTETLWHDLKQDGYSQIISNMAELQFMKQMAC